MPHFIPSDYSLDYTRTRPGGNRNLDLRREFKARVDLARIEATSILNGGFAELLAGQAPIILNKPSKILYWGSADQAIDFTTKDDVAQCTAAAALDVSAPRYLRIAGAVVTPRSLAQTMTEPSGKRFGLWRAGGIGLLSAIIRIAKTLAPEPQAVFPIWQGMQYLRDMASGEGKLQQLDNDRYGDVRLTGARDILARIVGTAAASARPPVHLILWRACHRRRRHPFTMDSGLPPPVRTRGAGCASQRLRGLARQLGARK